MKPRITTNTRITLRVNGTRIGDSSRPADDRPEVAHRLPLKRVQPALATRPNDYMPDDDEAVS